MARHCRRNGERHDALCLIQELLPESFAHATPTEAAWGVTIGLVGMLGFIAAIGL